MHGFVNLFCAASLVYFGHDLGEAEAALLEEDVMPWRFCDDSIAWKSHAWSVAQVRDVRLRFMNSFGSCSFEEPIGDLGGLGWL